MIVKLKDFDSELDSFYWMLQGRIQNLVKHLWWSFVVNYVNQPLTNFEKSSIIDP